MYFETTMHHSRQVEDAAAAAHLIKTNGARDYEALTWSASGRTLIVVAENHCDDPWLEVAVIDPKRQCQIESITAGWCENESTLTHLFRECETTDFVFRPKIRLPLDNQNADAPADFRCGCCGDSFESTYEKQRPFDQDNGYGICPRCVHN